MALTWERSWNLGEGNSYPEGNSDCQILLLGQQVHHCNALVEGLSGRVFAAEENSSERMITGLG